MITIYGTYMWGVMILLFGLITSQTESHTIRWAAVQTYLILGIPMYTIRRNYLFPD